MNCNGRSRWNLLTARLRLLSSLEELVDSDGAPELDVRQQRIVGVCVLVCVLRCCSDCDVWVKNEGAWTVSSSGVQRSCGEKMKSNGSRRIDPSKQQRSHAIRHDQARQQQRESRVATKHRIRFRRVSLPSAL